MSSLYLQQDNIVRFKRRKARFSFSEVHILLDEVRKNRHIVVGKFNAGVPADVKRRKWAEITARVNEIGESDREIMEVIKKWSDLKCDTKRKIAVLRNGGALSMRLARNHIELSPAELIVESILDLKKKSWDATPHTSSYGVREDQEVLGEDEEEEDVGFMGMESVSSSPGRGGEMGGTQALTSRPLLYNGPKTGDMESHMVDSDEDSHQHFASSSAAASSNSCSEENCLAFRDSSRQRLSSTASAKTTPSFSAMEPDSVREQMMNNAHRSVQEQHTSNTLLTAVSHSLEVLAQSVQQLAETQQQFVQESLQLQRETVQVLQEFTSGALTIIREKVNGKPVL